MGAYEHQELPFEIMVDSLQPERDTSRNPIFQVAFQYQNVDVGELTLPGLKLEEMESDFGAARLDLMLSMSDGDAGEMKGAFQYNTDIFEGDTIERMAGHYLNLLDGLLADPDEKIKEISILDESESYEQLVSWNKTTVDYPAIVGMKELLEEQVERSPENIAVKLDGEELSYKALNKKANQVARYLEELGSWKKQGCWAYVLNAQLR